jgi:anti-sigma regulatory factor (Ser/Thr protein kinase)
MSPKARAGPREAESVELCLPADPAAVRDAREVVRSTLTRWRLPHLVEACVLAVSELVTNALRHGRPPIDMRLRRVSKKVELEVEDQGSGPAEPPHPADDLAESGRGLGIVRAVADDVRIAGSATSVEWRAEGPAEEP